MENFLIKLLEWLYDIGEKYIFPWQIVRDYEGGVVLFLGKYHYSLNKGLNWKIPFLHESLTTLIKPETFQTENQTITTKDGKVISISFIARYEVDDAKKFLLEANDAASNLMHELIMAGCDYLTDCTYAEIIDKPSYTKIKNKVNNKITYMGARFTEIGFGSNCQTRPFSLINHN
jgi:hypothetical protein